MTRRSGARRGLSRPPSVLFLLPHLAVGGAQQGAAVLAEGLGPSWVVHAVGVKSPEQAGAGAEDMRGRFAEAGCRVADLDVAERCDRRPFALLRAAWRLRAYCRAHDIDIVDSAVLEADLVARLGLLGLRTRLVAHLVNTTYDETVQLESRSRSRWRPRAARWLDAASIRAASSIVAITGTVAASASQSLSLPIDRITVVPRGVDLDRFRPGPTQNPSGTVRLLAVGRLVPQKNHEVIIRALALLDAQGIEATLTIAGEGPLRDSLVSLADALGVAPRLGILAPVRDLRPVYATHDLFLFPSRWEGLGNALLEAMACGMPVITSDLPVFTEVTNGCGELVPVDDPVAWAQRISTVLRTTKPSLAERGAAARTHVVENYSSQSAVSAFKAHLSGLLA